MKKIKVLASIMAAFAVNGCVGLPSLSLGAGAGSEERQWTTLFDGTSTANWRTYGERTLRPQWQIVDGSLTLTEPGGGHITFGEVRGDFEFELSWRVQAGGNSGVFYLVDSADESAVYWQSGLEMQILDDVGHPDRFNPLTRAGSMFAIYAPEHDVSRGPGSWNTAHLIVRGSHVQHWLNGVKVVDADLDSPEFAARVRASKFATFASTFGKSRHGLILLQDHNERVEFRNIRIRQL